MSVQDLYQKACDAIERANYGYAIELLRQVLRQDPRYPEARNALRGTERRRLQANGRSMGETLAMPFTMALIGLKTVFGAPAKGLETYEDFLETYPNSFWALMKAAGAARKCGYESEAISMYTDAVRLKPTNKAALRAASDVLKEAGQAAEALKYLRRLVAMAPDDRDLQGEVRDLEAMRHMAKHQMEDATSFRDLIRDKDQAVRLEQSRHMTVSAGDLAQQVEELEKEVADNPKHPARILRLAQLYVDTDQLQKARKFIQEKHQLMPDNYEVREKLGDVEVLAYDRAIAAAAKKLEQNPQDAETSKKRDELQARRRALAAREYRWRLEQHPTDRELQFKLAQVQFEAGNYNEAIAGFQASTQDARFTVESAKMLGLCFMSKKQFDLALEQFQNAAQMHRDLDDLGKELLYYQARAHEEMGDKESALKIYKKVYSQDINFKDVAQKVDTLSA
jgi:tetratricopeptide (TPR) repeat protein